ncbi:Structural maintenance of chromosomes protein [Scedosporium apiospermum]|uniref:Structural maintenance of chromosomes protein n=1 Tax=Pseudallescheria apiosperma TaxID=563466 RepID=A0A084GHA7_PSEDA|nr:Structural maintenance of chromosomes protein [Scedosporium apiospermum]KEZ46719.1 Structural maintenance of chromosomes protein [Scedosporium apiospermum]
MGKLIRLELFNFKSYKGHHTLLFGDSYFTSIIGPNGSGKSNSMDAISFVLGIKSSHLRSAHLKDLIYRGRVLKTSKINDDGSADAPNGNGHVNGHGDNEDGDSRRASRNDPKTAWVMAVYEDDAGDEQKWKRSITSQGSSEYRINDRVVTAQQYNDALEAENILIKARNFLVFQGDVEAIAAQSPQDLTRLIEQISGSLEYKAEYERLERESEAAAENSAFHLHRRRGINSEIKQYQEQKREAENFQKKTDERDAAIVTKTLWKLYHFQRNMDDSSSLIHEHQENLKEFRRNVEVFEKKLETARKEQAVLAREVSKVERNIKTKERDIEDTRNGLVPINEKIEQSMRESSQLRERIDTLTKEENEQAELIKKVKSDLVKVEKAQEHDEKEYRDRMKKQGKELNDADRKQYNLLRAQVMAKTSANQTNLDNLLRQQKSDEVTVNTFKGRLDRVTATLEKFEQELQATTSRKSAAQASAQQLAKEIEAKKKEFNQIQSERVRTNQRRTELEERLEDVARKLREADDGRRQNDRETRLRDMVTSLKRIYPGVKGRVGDLCKPKQKRFDEAVIVALGRDFDSVIVDTEKTGVACVQYLKDQRFPPMTFIPLDNIKVSAVNTAIKGISGARLTIDTIDFDPHLERAMSYACGSSVVCDSLDIAKRICYERRIPVKAVTLEGFVIHKAGLMTGGRGPEHKGGKRRFEEHDVQHLQRLAAQCKDDLEKLPKADRRGNTEESLQIELSGLEQRLAYAKSELAALDKNLESTKKLRDNESKKRREIEPEFTQKREALERIVQTVNEFQEAISQVEDKIFGPFCKKLGYSNIREYEAQQGSMEQEMAEQRNVYEVQKQRLKSRLSWEESRYSESQARIERMQDQLRRLQKDVGSYRQEKKRIERELSSEEDELAALHDVLEEHKVKHADKSEHVGQARAEVQKRSKEIETRQKEISALETVVQQNSNGKFNLLRRCKLEQIQVPLLGGSLDDLPNEDNLLHQDPDAMDIDEEEDEEAEDREVIQAAMDDYGIELDFDKLDEELKDSDDANIEEILDEKIVSLTTELEKLNPNMRAIDRLGDVESRLKDTERDFEKARLAQKRARDAFNEIKTRRFELFNKAFSHIQEQISHVYKDLTRSEAYPLGGQAYLDIEEDTDTPYLSGIKYHAMPPLKRFRDMEHLSGGEKTMAALALLFAIHSYQPSPFFVLDEVDAALDNANVEKIKKYIREHSGPGMQFVVISLKTGLFQDSESLIGVYRDQDVNSSRTLTLDLRKYA